MTLAAPSVMASGQVYSPEEGEKRNNLLIWYTRLQYTHTSFIYRNFHTNGKKQKKKKNDLE